MEKVVYNNNGIILHRAEMAGGKGMDLFEYMRAENSKKESPLAARLRPRTLEEVVGQEHILGEGKLLSRAIQIGRAHV